MQKGAVSAMEPDDTDLNGCSQIISEVQVEVDRNLCGMRLDQFLAHKFPEFSRSLITTSIRDKSLSVNGSPKKSSYRLRTGEVVSGIIKVAGELKVEPEEIDFEILYEDEWLLLLTKPPGLVVHPGSGNTRGTLVNGLLFYCESIKGIGDTIRPGIVHRLDKDTSGVMVVAKTENTHRGLVEIFKEHQVKKEYLALVCGVVQEREGRVVASIGRHQTQRQKMAVRELGGKHAATNWELVKSFDDHSLLKVRIETGRTHQIRVHMAHLGFPVAGDCIYGPSKSDSRFPRQMLHAWRLAFTHPITGKAIDCKADLWPDFKNVLQESGGTDHLGLL